MTNITANAPRSAGFNFGTFFTNAIADFKAARAKRAVFKETYLQLNSMTDRELTDMGISRLVVRDIALKAAAAHV